MSHMHSCMTPCLRWTMTGVTFTIISKWLLRSLCYLMLFCVTTMVFVYCGSTVCSPFPFSLKQGGTMPLHWKMWRGRRSKLLQFKNLSLSFTYLGNFSRKLVLPWVLSRSYGKIIKTKMSKLSEYMIYMFGQGCSHCCIMYYRVRRLTLVSLPYS